MAAVSKLEGPFPIRCTIPNAYIYCAKFTSNTASDPAAISPTGASTGGGGETIAYGGSAGVINITFPSKSKPEAMYQGIVTVLGDEPNLSAKVESYTPSTGVLKLRLYTNAAGTITSANTASKVYQVYCVFTRNA